MGKKDNRGKGKVSSESAKPVGECWYAGMNHQQFHKELSLESSGNVFPHGPQQKKQKKNH